MECNRRERNFCSWMPLRLDSTCSMSLAAALAPADSSGSTAGAHAARSGVQANEGWGCNTTGRSRRLVCHSWRAAWWWQTVVVVVAVQCSQAERGKTAAVAGCRSWHQSQGVRSNSAVANARALVLSSAPSIIGSSTHVQQQRKQHTVSPLQVHSQLLLTPPAAAGEPLAICLSVVAGPECDSISSQRCLIRRRRSRMWWWTGGCQPSCRGAFVWRQRRQQLRDARHSEAQPALSRTLNCPAATSSAAADAAPPTPNPSQPNNCTPTQQAVPGRRSRVQRPAAGVCAHEAGASSHRHVHGAGAEPPAQGDLVRPSCVCVGEGPAAAALSNDQSHTTAAAEPGHMLLPPPHPWRLLAGATRRRPTSFQRSSSRRRRRQTSTTPPRQAW